MSINATVLGRLTRDPEAKTSQNGNNYVDFTVAVNHGKDPQTGVEKATFVELTAYGKTGEIILKLKKGGRVSVSADLELEKWTAQNGATGATLRGKNVRSIDIIDWPENAQQTQQAPRGYGVQPQYGAPPVQGGYQAPPQQAPMPGYGAPPAYGQPPVQQPLQYQQPPTQQQQAPVQQGYGQPAPTAQPGPGNTPW